MREIPKSEWEWYGCPGHLIVAQDCRLHLCTVVGSYLVSTVGEYLPDEGVREIIANVRGNPLEGQGDARRADWMNKFGWEPIGAGGKESTYETMVFRVDLAIRCVTLTCACGFPMVDFSDLEGERYGNAGDATRGHMRFCEKYARRGV